MHVIGYPMHLTNVINCTFENDCCSFQVYTGKEKQVRERGLGHRVVVDLVRPYAGRGYHVYFDNFFTSVPLVRELARHRTLVWDGAHEQERTTSRREEDKAEGAR